MITTKQRAYLRGLGAKLTPIFQIGKNGIEDNFLKQVDDALEAREILKINVLENSGLETREASNFICERLGCEGVQSIGNKIVLYRAAKNNPKIELPKKGK
ncbi:ribosome assembly RNA-binding protein YhbY [Clostridium perfringens]|uniref:ribosome assembly RNA-binding protein YhbY n=1 Tax=Clostridium perfringens TaxID=1502 RepID=UPI000D7138E9|nr:ribosome assembly RNA-binding protein YhbY [Clostridium perfringens]PWX65887.1 ribosome assembly RNA-binding protein YhbY [Clostridium perfringens]